MMKNSLKIFFICLFFVSCQQKITSEDISKLNGYWEIEKVTFKDGDDKDFKMNENFDYFKIANNKGIRRKVRPQFNGTFLFNDDYEMRVKNDQNKEYAYKKAGPINLLEDGEKTK